MKKSRFTEEQIIGFLQRTEVGLPIKEVCGNGGFSDATSYEWRCKSVAVKIFAERKLFPSR